MNRIRSLDGLRAISIIMVLLVHAKHTMPPKLANNLLFKYVIHSDLGVHIFFVISGYLITKLLLQEREKTNDINIKNFYIRRSLRIFPVFYTYIFIIIILKQFFLAPGVLTYTTIAFASLYLWNYMHLLTVPQPNPSLFFGHFWTLAMEEQFYLLWPIAFKRIPRKKLITVVLIIIAIMPIIRIATYIYMPNSRGQIGMMIHTSGDTILTGCLGALLEKSFLNSSYAKWLKNNLVMSFIVFFIFVISPYFGDVFKGAYTLTIGQTISNLSIIVFVLWCIYEPTWLSSLLNSKPFVHIGMLSYSLYIWHLLFIRDINSVLANPNAESFWFNRFPQNLFFVYLAGIMSFYLIETPLNKLRNKFHKNAKESELEVST
ncbi:hypothetical protein GCM10028808_45880 [Spirosoma migulaei]